MGGMFDGERSREKAVNTNSHGCTTWRRNVPASGNIRKTRKKGLVKKKIRTSASYKRGWKKKKNLCRTVARDGLRESVIKSQSERRLNSKKKDVVIVKQV